MLVYCNSFIFSPLRVNQDWENHMSEKMKPRKLERIANPPEESPVQTYRDKQLALGRQNGFVSSRQHKKDGMKKDNLVLLLSLNEYQPEMKIWTKAWKISQPLPQPEQISPASIRLESTVENLDPVTQTMKENYGYNNINKLSKNKPMSDWKQPWKYTKQRKESNSARNGPKHVSNGKLGKLLESQSHSEERQSFEWNNSWISVKPHEEEIMTSH